MIRCIFCRFVSVVCVMLCSVYGWAQTVSVPTTIAGLEARLAILGVQRDSAGAVVLMNELTRVGRIPFAVNDTVLFVYVGTSQTVGWNGDFSGWRTTIAGTQIRLSTTSNFSVWTCKMALPTSARVDYKIVLTGNNFILDPANPLQQWGGFGPNSELQMPEFRPSPDAVERASIQRGRITDNIRFRSTALGYDVQYRVYLPPNYDSTRTYPSLYVMDGQEYGDARLGGLPTVLDNLTADGVLQRGIIAVLVDPRDPNSLSTNRRMSEYATTPTHLQYLVNEVVPRVDSAYRTIRRADSRGVLGTSLGGLTSAYCAISRPDVFGITGIHSPAFWFRTGIFTQWRDTPMRPLRIVMTTGTMFDTQDDARQMRSVMQEKGYTLQYREVPQSHSWGNWRFLMSETIRGMFAPVASSVNTSERNHHAVRISPNPAHDSIQMNIVLPMQSMTLIEIIDARGQSVYSSLEQRAQGEQQILLSVRGYASGTYSMRVQSGSVQSVVPFVIAR